jgi:hypothetical protein
MRMRFCLMLWNCFQFLNGIRSCRKIDLREIDLSLIYFHCFGCDCVLDKYGRFVVATISFDWGSQSGFH